MQVPLELSFRRVSHESSIEKLIREKVAKLEEVNPRMIGCRVVVEKTQEHQARGRPYRVRLEIAVPPRHEIVVVRAESKGDIHYPLSSIIRDAFRTARRHLKALNDKQRREVKFHPQQEVNAFVAKLYSEEGYGFLRTLDGQEVYFHRNSVSHHEFDRLQVGTGVHCVTEAGEEGLQASTVRISGKQPNL